MPNDLTATPELRAQMLAMGERARAAARGLAKADAGAKNRALELAAAALVDREKSILAANAKDVKAARAEGNDDAFIDRLALTAKAIGAMAEGLRAVIELPDPVGEITGLGSGPRASRSDACACRSA
jgi:glutamate-5-semialdehyde dehydrogenase